ncbi:hypothetical protein [Leifsonia sp. Root112D2]|uniref:hypothetical protein n=1 Tax=Leifsonia sp. Root112D2 TaxID=1736426 RepID=UPI0006FB4408|nr:hypothetical protein [Leifsonia sp. Root112D2]KQV06553.1 hypothetical protein ASC63_03755 [Leifsonia sp. Root112D2]
MPVTTSRFLSVDDVYTRAELREAFNITDATINNGIFQPNNHASIWLFVTQFKTPDRTQYRDELNGDILTMESQPSARNDEKLRNHGAYGTEIILFYRRDKFEHPGAGFKYEGRFSYRASTESAPAVFTFERLR